MRLAEVAERFRQTWLAASTTHREQAAVWYWRANWEIRRICQGRVLDVCPFRMTALLAINTRWQHTLTRLTHWAAGQPLQLIPVVQRAYERLQRGRWETGPKTMAFAELLANPDAERMALDRHVLAVLGLPRRRRVDAYQMVEDVGRNVAGRLGIRPGTLQACLWIVQRQSSL